MQHDDAAAGRAVEEIAGVRTQERCQNAHRRGDFHHAAEAIGEQIGRRAGRDQHRDDEARTDGLQRRDGGGGEQSQQRHVEHSRIEADRAGLIGIEREQQQVLPLEPQDQQRDRGDDQHLHDVGVGDSQDVAEDDCLEADVAREHRDDQHAGGEERGKDEADDGIFADRWFWL